MPSRRRFMDVPSLRVIGAASLFIWATMLSGCWFDENDESGGTTSASPAVRIEAFPKAVLFTGIGMERRITFKAFDASGNETTMPALTVSSSRSSEIFVDSNGLAKAMVSMGSGVIQASSGTIVSNPITVIAAEIETGVTLINDDQFIGEPRYPGNKTAIHDVVADVDVIPGQIIASTGGYPAAGRVESVEINGASKRFTVSPVNPTDIFKTLALDATYTLPNTVYELPEEQILRQRALAVDEKKGICNPKITSPVGPKLSVSIKPTSSIKNIVSTFKLNLGTENKPVSIIAVTGDAEFGINFSLGLTEVAKYSYACRLPFGKPLLFPIGGAISVIVTPAIQFSGDLDFDVGFSADIAKISWAPKASAKFEAGLVNDGTGWASTSNVTNTTPDLPGPTVTPFSFSVKAELFAGLGVRLQLYSPLFDEASDMVQLQTGPKISSTWAPALSQVTDIAADYKISYVTQIGPGEAVKDALEKFLEAKDFKGSKVKFELVDSKVELGRSPALLEAVAELPVNEPMKFSVELNNTELLGYYNITDVLIYAVRSAFVDAELLATHSVSAQEVSNKATKFSLAWKPTFDLNSSVKFYAFVKTAFGLSDGPLLVGKVDVLDAEQFWAAASDFSAVTNPGSVWLYGYDYGPTGYWGSTPRLTGRKSYEGKVDAWVDPDFSTDGAPVVGHNNTAQLITVLQPDWSSAPISGISYYPDEVIMHPAVRYFPALRRFLPVYAKLFFIAPKPGRYKVNARFVSRDAVGATTSVIIYANTSSGGKSLTGLVSIDNKTDRRIFEDTVDLLKDGDISFSVGPSMGEPVGHEDMLSDSTGLMALITYLGPIAP